MFWHRLCLYRFQFEHLKVPPVFLLNSAVIQLLPVFPRQLWCICFGRCPPVAFPIAVVAPSWLYFSNDDQMSREAGILGNDGFGSIASDRWWSGWSKRLLLLEICFVDSFRSKVVDCPTLLRGPAMTNLFFWLWWWNSLCLAVELDTNRMHLLVREWLFFLGGGNSDLWDLPFGKQPWEWGTFLKGSSRVKQENNALPFGFHWPKLALFFSTKHFSKARPYTPLTKITWIPKMMGWKMYFLSNMFFFLGIYVRFCGV